MREFFRMSVDEVRRELGSDTLRGLTQAAALERLAEFGPNEISESKKKTYRELFLGQFKNFLIVILLIAALISVLIGEFIDGSFIMFIVLVNAFLGATQEIQAEREIRALKKMVIPTANVVRDNEVKKVPAAEVVPGDIIVLETGSAIPADARIFEAVNLKVEEAALTGESAATLKGAAALEGEVALAERSNMVFMGTAVVYGRGKAMVTSTGMRSELGTIARLVQSEKKEETPLEKRFAQFGKWIGIAAIAICVMIFVTGFGRGIDIFEMFLTAVSLAVAAVPEGLPAVIAITLALGARRMARRKAVIRNLAAVETLGSVTTICSDKTGTMTQNKMVVEVMAAGNKVYAVTGQGYKPHGDFILNEKLVNALEHPDLALLLTSAVLCNDAHLLKQKEEGDEGGEYWQVLGDPTEGCLLVAGAKAGLTKENLSPLYSRIAEVPFDSNRKRMSTIHRHPREGFVVFAKGALEGILEHCMEQFVDGRRELLNDLEKYEILEKSQKFAELGLRILGFAYKKAEALPHTIHEETIERGLVFLGFCGMIDPPRKEVESSIRICAEAKITPIMITGDNKTTALAIARDIGIATEAAQMMEGHELEIVEEERLARIIDRIRVFARVSPEHKLKIVNALTRRGNIVAMTGDGVNDAPALKRAHIGVAMGITGTDVAKEAADMVLTDDNFATIVHAVEEGRGIFENIRKFVRYMLTTNMGELLTMFFALLLNMPLPLIPVQILWVNLVTDGLPALALGVEPTEGDLMKRPPRDSKAGILNAGMIFSMVSIALYMAAVTLLLFWWTWEKSGSIATARTVAFLALTLLQVAHVLICRSDRRTIFELGLNTNPYLNGAILSSIFLQLLVIYLPACQVIFKTKALGIVELLVVFAASFSLLLFIEVKKWFISAFDLSSNRG